MPLRTVFRSVLSLPLPLGPRPVNDRGGERDAPTHRMRELLRLSGRPTLDQLGPDRAREETRRLSHVADVAPRALPAVEDRSGPVPLRLYHPSIERALPRPATLYVHGGGFVIGDLDSHDALCRALAERSRSIVVALDYRLAPEHPFPAAPDDVLATYRWLREHAAQLGIDASRIAVAGDSAGGNLSAVLCHDCRRQGLPMPAFQLLIYPATDLGRTCESHRLFGQGFFLTTELKDWFIANYLLDPADEKNVRASPLFERDLAGLPPAHVVTAGFDPLRDEGELYAHSLREAGVATTLRCYDSLVHGFASMGGVIEAAERAVDDLGDVLRRALWP